MTTSNNGRYVRLLGLPLFGMRYSVNDRKHK